MHDIRRLLLLCLGLAGCLRPNPNEVVVYTALDREFSEPIFAEFTKETGIRVLAKYDAESTKTVGLTNAIIAEAARPRCDVFWNNEIIVWANYGRCSLEENDRFCWFFESRLFCVITVV